MNNFERAHNQYLEPPEDDPCCEDGCGEVLERDVWTHNWICPNKFCPLKFSGVEKEMAEALIEANASAETFRKLNIRKSDEIEVLKELVKDLQWTIQENNK